MVIVRRTENPKANVQLVVAPHKLVGRSVSESGPVCKTGVFDLGSLILPLPTKRKIACNGAQPDLKSGAVREDGVRFLYLPQCVSGRVVRQRSPKP